MLNKYMTITGSFIFWSFTEFPINTVFNTKFSLKNKVMLEFGIIPSLMLIASSNGEFKMGHKTQLPSASGQKLI